MRASGPQPGFCQAIKQSGNLSARVKSSICPISFVSRPLRSYIIHFGDCFLCSKLDSSLIMTPYRLIRMPVRTFVLSVVIARSHAAAPTFLPDKVKCAIQDRQDFQSPDHIHLTGWVGQRIQVNESNRLAKLDPDRLLEGYRKRPGRQSWDGEHVGKWLHAATLAWVNTGDAALREKLDATVAELVKCQLDAGNLETLSCCRRMGDLLCRTFGDEPGKRDIIKAGEHVGLAPTSVLEPMVLLYRFTGERRYLDFCKYIFRAWEQPNGPKVISTLLTAKRVDKVGNGKAYEMLSCLNGALEYYRTVGDRDCLQACLNAWQDIVDHRLYLTGTASYEEFFHDDFD